MLVGQLFIDSLELISFYNKMDITRFLRIMNERI